MKRRILINRKARVANLPKDLVEDGWSGETDAYADAFTLTLVKPGTSLVQVKRSLSLVMRDLDMRIEQRGNGAITKAVVATE